MALQKILFSVENDSRFRLHRHQLSPLPHSPVLIDIYHHHVERESPISFVPLRTAASFLMLTPQNSEQSSNIEIVYARRGAPILQQFDIVAFRQKCKYKNFNPLHKFNQNILSKIMGVIDKGRSIEIIKTEWPHGKELQVSYLGNYNRWIVSNGYVSLTATLQQNKESFYPNQNTQLISLAKIWFELLSTLKNTQLLKTTLKTHTLCGKVNASCIDVIFYALVKTNPNNSNESLCEDPFDAQQKMQKLGLRFIKIKSLGILNQQDQIIKNIQKAYQTVITGFLQPKNHVYGRSKIYFVANGTSEVIGGYNFYTLEDLILNDMRQLIVSSREVTCNQFKQKLQTRVKDSESRLVYPEMYYIKLFDNLKTYIKYINASEESIKSNWFKFIKTCLFLQSKRLQMINYAPILMKNQSFVNKISQHPLQSFGPVSCKINLIYFAVGLAGTYQKQLSKALNQQFIQLNLHFQTIEAHSKQQFSMDDIINQISAPSHHQLKHYFITYCPRAFQIQLLQKQLSKHHGKDVYYKIILIAERLSNQTIISQNNYPQSYYSIINAYYQAFQLVRNSRKDQEKIIYLRKVTENLLQFKNYDLLSCKNIIEINFNDQSYSLQQKYLIQKIFNSDQDDYKCYQSLLLYLQKYNKDQTRKLVQSHAEIIISNSYYKIPNIPLD